MKKTYISPALEIETAMDTESVIAASITRISGDSGLELGTGDDIPTEADAKEDLWGGLDWE